MKQKFKIPSPRQRSIPQTENLFKILLFTSVVFCIFYLTQKYIDNFQGSLSNAQGIDFILGIGIIITSAFIAGFFLLGLELLVHESVHKVLFKNLFLNDLFGLILCNALLLIPFSSYRESHIQHHRYTHRPGLDPEESFFDHSLFWMVLFSGSLSSNMMYRLFFKNIFLSLSQKNIRIKVILDLLFLMLGLWIYLIFIPSLGISIWYTFVPTVITMLLIVAIRNLPSHYGIPASSGPKDIPTGWIIKTNSLIEWVWSNANYHEIHHQYPYLSYKDLDKVFKLTKDTFPYAVTNGYLNSFIKLKSKRYYENRF